MTEWVDHYGLILLFGVIAAQAAGVGGLPGKTTLVAAAILAARGHFAIADVIAVAAVAGTVGGYTGYAVGRVGGRRLVERPRVQKRMGAAVGVVERLFQRHGAKAVFVARFLPGAKVVAAPLAGVAHMRWWRFASWHALGALAFALGFGLLGYYGGEGAIALAERLGLYAVIPLVPILLALWLGWTMLRRRDRMKVMSRPEARSGTWTRPPAVTSRGRGRPSARPARDR